MITLTLQFDGAKLAQMRQLQTQFPREMQRANGRVASIVKRKLRAAMAKGGGTADVPAFAPLSPVSLQLNRRTLPGGKLAQPAVIVAYRLGRAQVVGWPDGLSGFASLFQSDEQRPTTKEERRYMHKRAVADVPAYYNRPARAAIEPLTAAVAPEYPRWFESAALKLIQKSLAKQGF